MAYKAVFNGNSLYHINNLRWPAGTPGGRGGQFREGDGDGDGQTEYQDSLRRKADSAAARERLDSYYKNEGRENYKSSTEGPSGRVRSRNPYVDNDGNLTSAGERRWEAEKKANAQKSKKNRVEDPEDLKDPNKWVKDDLNTMKDLAKAHKDVSDESIKLIDQIFKTKPNKRLDLSNMSDQELRNILNREQLERQYNDIFNKPQENKGKDFVKKVFDINSTLAASAIAGLTIAVLIKQLKTTAVLAAL